MRWPGARPMAIVLVMGAASCGGGDATTPSTPGAAASAVGPRAGVAVQETWFPSRGDCGVADELGRVERAWCGSARADVVVHSIQWGGDPGYLCPLITKTSVLVSELPDGWFACWVRIGRPPIDRFGEGGVEAVVAQGVQLPSAGACGDIHDEHVHYTLDCGDPRADGTVLATSAEATDGAACPDATTIWIAVEPVGIVCWALR